MSNHLPNRAALAAGLLSLGLATGAAAASAPFLHLPFAPGEVTDEGHERWIDLHSVQWGAAMPVTPSLPGSGRRSGTPQVSEVVWTQSLDTSVPLLLGGMFAPKPNMKATFDLRDEVSPRTVNEVTLTVEKSVVTSVSQGNTSVSASLNGVVFTLEHQLGDARKPDNGRVVFDQSKVLSEGATSRAPRSFTGTEPAAAPGGGVTMYLRLGEGSNAIAGVSQALGYENWSVIDSTSWGVGLGYDPDRGIVSKPSFSDLTWTQPYDATATVLLANLFRGNDIGQSVIEFVRDAGAGPVTFMQLALDGAMFSGFSMAASEEGPVYVSASLGFTAFSQTVWEILPNGERGDFTTVGFDVARNTPIEGALAREVPGFGAGNLAAIAPVPEPETWALFAAGLIGISLWSRRRRA